MDFANALRFLVGRSAAESWNTSKSYKTSISGPLNRVHIGSSNILRPYHVYQSRSLQSYSATS